MFYTYILQSQASGYFYKGATGNLQQRIKTQNEGWSPYTKGRGPWVLIHFEAFHTRSEAVKKERFCKSAAGKRWIKEQFGKKG
jgi:putative endonuclease